MRVAERISGLLEGRSQRSPSQAVIVGLIFLVLLELLRDGVVVTLDREVE